MAATVLSIAEKNTSMSSSIVEILEDFLARAKRGELRAVAMVAVDSSDYARWATAVGGKFTAIQLVAASALLHRHCLENWESK